MSPVSPFRVAFVAGVMPGKWERIWAERVRRPLQLVPVDVSDQERVIRDGEVDMAFVRDMSRSEGLHLIPLYREQPVVVASIEHPVSAYDEIDVADLADEYRHQVPPLSAKDAVEAVAAGTGVVVLPRSLARLHQRKDVKAVPVSGVEESPIGLAWLVANEDPDVQTFIGIVRGRSANSSRG